MYDPDTGEMRPVPGGKVKSGMLVGENGQVIGDEDVVINHTGYGEHPPAAGTETLDPLTIPVMLPFIRYRADTDAPQTWFNQLQVDWSEGLYVEPPKNASGNWIDFKQGGFLYTDKPSQQRNLAQHTIITAHDAGAMFKDCDDEYIPAFGDSEGGRRIVTCDKFENLKNELISVINTLLDEVRRTVTDLYDATTAVSDVQPGAADPGTDQTNDTPISYDVTMGVLAPFGTGTENEKLNAPKIIVDRALLNAGEVYALDVFYENGGQSFYRGTYYYSASGAGYQYGSKATFVVTQLAKDAWLFTKAELAKYNFVLRKLRAGESAVNVSDMTPGYF